MLRTFAATLIGISLLPILPSPTQAQSIKMFCTLDSAIRLYRADGETVEGTVPAGGLINITDQVLKGKGMVYVHNYPETALGGYTKNPESHCKKVTVVKTKQI